MDIVHIVRDTIEVPNQHIYGGMRLQSDARGSLVVKFQNQDNELADTINRRQAGIVVGGTPVTAEDQFIDIDDRIGGSLANRRSSRLPGGVDRAGGRHRWVPDSRKTVVPTSIPTTTEFDLMRTAIRSSCLTGDTMRVRRRRRCCLWACSTTARIWKKSTTANLIDNDIDPQVIGFLEAEIEYGGQIEDDVRFTYLNTNPADGGLGPLQLANVEFPVHDLR